MLEQFILGAIQGITEWLPISSEGALVLVSANFFGETFSNALENALFLHLGTVLAALIYFWKDVVSLIKGVFIRKDRSVETGKTLRFLVITTLISGTIGLLFIKIIPYIEDSIISSAQAITILIGTLLIVTGVVQLSHKNVETYKSQKDIKKRDDILLGLVQGLATLPGFSRSGLTVSVLLLRRYTKETALKLSFLMSIPIVLAGNIALNFNEAVLTKPSLVGLLASFLFGLITIDILLRVARKINFGYFVIVFGVLALIAGFI